MRVSLRSIGTRVRHHPSKTIVFSVVALALVGVDLMFYFWPFRYREVQPLLQQVFRSRVDVRNYHRTYFPHPGFVAEGVTFYRHGDMSIPPLATVERMQVIGTWTTLLFHPHLLYEIQLRGLHVRIPPAGTKARGTDFDQGVVDTSQSKLQIETIVADGTTLDFLRSAGLPPLRFWFAALQIHNVRKNRPLQFTTRVTIPGPQGTVTADGSFGPVRTDAYGSTPLLGTYSLVNADLSRVDGIAGHVTAHGRFGGTPSRVEIRGQAAIPDFRAGSAQTVRLDADYRIAVNGTNQDVEIESAKVKSGESVIFANGSVMGSAKKVALTIATNGSRMEDLLRIVEQSDPQVAGAVSFQAQAEFVYGPGRFLQRLKLNGKIALDHMRFTRSNTEKTLDAFSARVRRDPAGDPKADPPEVSANADSATRFANGMAYFPNIRVVFPGAAARLHGSFNLLDSRIHLLGQVALQRGISHAATGWKALLLKPLTPFFRHKSAGALVPVAVTGTAQNPKVGADLLHDK